MREALERFKLNKRRPSFSKTATLQFNKNTSISHSHHKQSKISIQYKDHTDQTNICNVIMFSLAHYHGSYFNESLIELRDALDQKTASTYYDKILFSEIKAESKKIIAILNREEKFLDLFERLTSYCDGLNKAMNLDWKIDTLIEFYLFQIYLKSILPYKALLKDSILFLVKAASAKLVENLLQNKLPENVKEALPLLQKTSLRKENTDTFKDLSLETKKKLSHHLLKVRNYNLKDKQLIFFEESFSDIGKANLIQLELNGENFQVHTLAGAPFFFSISSENKTTTFQEKIDTRQRYLLVKASQNQIKLEEENVDLNIKKISDSKSNETGYYSYINGILEIPNNNLSDHFQIKDGHYLLWTKTANAMDFCTELKNLLHIQQEMLLKKNFDRIPHLNFTLVNDLDSGFNEGPTITEKLPFLLKNTHQLKSIRAKEKGLNLIKFNEEVSRKEPLLTNQIYFNIPNGRKILEVFEKLYSTSPIIQYFKDWDTSFDHGNIAFNFLERLVESIYTDLLSQLRVTEDNISGPTKLLLKRSIYEALTSESLRMGQENLISFINLRSDHSDLDYLKAKLLIINHAIPPSKNHVKELHIKWGHPCFGPSCYNLEGNKVKTTSFLCFKENGKIILEKMPPSEILDFIISETQ